MVQSVASVGKKGFDMVTSLVSKNRRFIEGFLVAFIVIKFLPRNLFGMNVKSAVEDIARPVTNFFNNDIFSFVVLIVMLWACCIKQDMDMFVLVVLFLLVHKVQRL